MKKIRTKIAIGCSVALLTMGIYVPAVFATGSTNVDELLGTMNGVYAQLYDEERIAVDQAQLLTSQLTDPEIIDEIWVKIASELGEGTTTLTQAKVLELFAYIGTIYDPATGALDQIPPALQETLDELVELSDLTGSLTKESLAAFALEIETAALGQIPSNYQGLIDLAKDKAALQSTVETTIESVMNSTDLDFVNVLKSFDITTADVKAVGSRIMSLVDPNKDAAIALMLGYLRASTPNQLFLGNPLVELDDESRVFGSIRVMDITDIMTSVFTWESTNGTAVVDTNGEFIVTVPEAGQKTTLTATFDLGELDTYNLLNGRVLFRQEVYVGEPITELVLESSSDVAGYKPGELVELSYVLNGFIDNDDTNSAEFKVQFNPNVFELLTGDVNNSVVPGHIAASAVSYNETLGEVTYLITDPAPNLILNGEKAFTLKLKVKEGASGGTHSITSPESTLIGYINGDDRSVILPATLVDILVDSPIVGNSVSGVALLGSRSDNNHSGITVELQGTGISAVTAADGSFTLTGAQPGTYTLLIDKTYYLAAGLTIIIVDGENLILSESIALIPGDANDDNTVGLPDLGELASAFGATTPSDPQYNIAADFNGDGSVGLPDLGTLASSFGQVGYSN